MSLAMMSQPQTTITTSKSLGSTQRPPERPIIRTLTAAESVSDFWLRRGGKAVPAQTRGRGRGLFAAAAIATGELIDRACTIPIAVAQCPTLDRLQPLGDFYFRHPEDENAGLMVLGLASLCNHADAPNADVLFVNGNGLGWLADLVALRAIRPGEEITYRYRCPLWFSAATG